MQRPTDCKLYEYNDVAITLYEQPCTLAIFNKYNHPEQFRAPVNIKQAGMQDLARDSYHAPL